MSEKKTDNLSQLSTGLKTIDQFINISKTVAKLPALVLADAEGASNDFVEICKQILDGNENVVRWFNNFLYFDFTESDAVKKFTELKKEYEALKAGSGYQKLKFNCGEIAYIYHKRISSKLGEWFQRKKLKEAKEVFDNLTVADAEMVSFVFVEVFGKLSAFADEVEKHVIDNNDLRKVEEIRLNFKVETKKLVPKLQGFSNDLAELILKFSEKTRTG
jgi:hypothetical protein